MERRWAGSVDIDAPVEEVYRYLADFPRHAEWAQTLERLELLQAGDATGAGARYLSHERQAFQSDRTPRGPIEKGMRAKTICYVTELQPHRRIAWRAHPTPRQGVSAQLAFDLEPLGDSRTRLTQHIVMRMAFVWQPLMRLMGATPEKAHAQWQASLCNIKEIIEGDRRATQPAQPAALAK